MSVPTVPVSDVQYPASQSVHPVSAPVPALARYEDEREARCTGAPARSDHQKKKADVITYLEGQIKSRLPELKKL